MTKGKRDLRFADRGKGRRTANAVFCGCARATVARTASGRSVLLTVTPIVLGVRWRGCNSVERVAKPRVERDQIRRNRDRFRRDLAPSRNLRGPVASAAGTTAWIASTLVANVKARASVHILLTQRSEPLVRVGWRRWTPCGKAERRTRRLSLASSPAARRKRLLAYRPTMPGSRRDRAGAMSVIRWVVIHAQRLRGFVATDVPTADSSERD